MLQYGYIIDSEMIFMMCARRIIVIFIRIGYGVFSGNGNLLIGIINLSKYVFFCHNFAIFVKLSTKLL